jgi:hypothetical protein
MAFHIVINMENGTRLAVAAFTSADRAQAYIERHGMAEVRIDFFDPGDQVPQNPRVLYVSQREVRPGVHELAGYFFSRYEAERAVAGQGFERRLEINSAEFIDFELPPSAPADADPSPVAEAAPTPARRRFLPERPARRAAARGPAVFPVGQIVLLVLLVCGILGAYWFFHRSPAIQFGEAEASAAWLPASASDISYFRQGRFEAAEFLIAEEGFRIWARGFGAEPGPVPPDGATVPRYLMLAVAAGIKPAPAPGVPRATMAEVRDGLYWTSLPPAQIITLAWDRRTGRAYLYRQ